MSWNDQPKKCKGCLHYADFCTLPLYMTLLDPCPHKKVSPRLSTPRASNIIVGS